MTATVSTSVGPHTPSVQTTHEAAPVRPRPAPSPAPMDAPAARSTPSRGQRTRHARSIEAPRQPAATEYDLYAELLDRLDLDALEAELDQVRRDILDSLGPDDDAYIRRMIRTQRGLDLAGRAALWAGVFPPAWLAGVAMLGVAKILENMEIGHNVLHGQWDWLDDPAIHSTTWEWDTFCPADQWKHSHNELHHQWTSIEGVDHDLGYRVVRIHDEQRHLPAHRFQPLSAMVLALAFDLGIALHDVDGLGLAAGQPIDMERAWPKLKHVLAKIGRQARKDYVAFPALSAVPFGPAGVVASASGAAAANVVRNLWSFAVIFCGHFPDGVSVFPREAADDERQGAWYLRQILGSANFEGGALMHVLSGNLDHQIEHHLFPDVPSNRYAEAAPKVQEICERHGIPYNTGSFPRQLATVARKIWNLRRPS